MRQDRHAACAGGKPRVAWAMVAGWLLLGWATFSPAVAAVALSRSGQFAVHSPHLTTPTLTQAVSPSTTNLVLLEPAPLTVACERIKEALLRELRVADRWQGQVHFWLRPGAAPGREPELLSTRYIDGWQYSIELPEQVAPVQLVRTVVYVLLAEMANRSPGPHPPELPIWLVEGFTNLLLSRFGPDLVPQPNPMIRKFTDGLGRLEPTTREQAPAEVVRALRDRLRLETPLSFADLSLPTPDLLNADKLPTYRVFARVFLEQLLALPAGPDALGSMLSQLTRTLNWQTAFMRAFERHFSRLLDVEKWWAVVLFQFTARDLAEHWSLAVSYLKLEEVLRVPVEIRQRPGELPRRDVLTLSQVLEQWELGAQTTVMRAKVQQLQALQFLVAPEARPLVTDYLATLGGFVDQAVRLARGSSGGTWAAADWRPLSRSTLRRFEALEHRRLQLQSMFQGASPAEAPPPSTPAPVGAPASSPPPKPPPTS